MQGQLLSPAQKKRPLKNSKISRRSPCGQLSLITQNLPSKRLITPITSALHGAVLTFIAWLALMMAEALFKKTPDDNDLDRVLYLHGLLLGSMVLGSSTGYVSGLLYQRWSAARPYGLLLRNVLSASAALLLSGVTYKIMENLTLFKKDDRCTYPMKDQCALHLVVAVICFLVCTELIRSRRDHRSLPADPTKLVTLGHAFLKRGAVGMLFFICTNVDFHHEYKYRKQGFLLYTISTMIFYGISALLARGVYYLFWRKTQYGRLYKKGTMHLFFLAIVSSLTWLFSRNSYKSALLYAFLPALYGMLYDMVLCELAWGYYVRLLLRQGAEGKFSA